MTNNSNSSNGATKCVLMPVRRDSRNLDLMLQHEVFVMRDIIMAAGFSVDIVTEDDDVLEGQTVELKPTVDLGSIKVSDYEGLMLPCMAPVPGTPMPDKFLRIIEEAVKVGLPIGAMHGSVRELARVGGLEGHRYSFSSRMDVKEHPDFANATFVGTGVTTDKLLATAGICPLAAKASLGSDDTATLTEAFVSILVASTGETDAQRRGVEQLARRQSA